MGDSLRLVDGVLRSFYISEIGIPVLVVFAPFFAKHQVKFESVLTSLLDAKTA
jgi:hypothetical protein